MSPKQSIPLTSNRSVSIILFTVITALFLFIYFETISSIVKGWFTHSVSHGFLIFAVSIYIIWHKRSYLRTILFQPDLVKGTLLTLFGCLMLVAGKLSMTILMQKVSLIVILLGLVWLLMGFTFLKAIYLPICYLIFTFPIFDTVLGNQIIYFQLIAAHIASNLLNLTGIPVLHSGQLITLPHITLDVAKECSGINHILALVAIAIPLAYLTQKTRFRKGMLVLIAFCIGILANGLRVAIIGIWTHLYKGVSAHGPFDIFLVSFIFGFGLIVLIAIAIIQGRISLKKIRNGVANKLVPKSTNNIYNHRIAALITAVAVLFVTGGYLYLYKPVPVYLKRDLKQIPMVISNWVGRDIDRLGEPFEIIDPDIRLKRAYHDSNGSKINLYVGYFATQSQDRKVFNSRYSDYQQNSNGFGTPTNSGMAFRSNHQTKSENKNIYSCYIVNGRMIDKSYLAKLAIIEDAFIRRRNNAAIIILTTESKGVNQNNKLTNPEIEFINLLIPILKSYLL